MVPGKGGGYATLRQVQRQGDCLRMQQVYEERKNNDQCYLLFITEYIVHFLDDSEEIHCSLSRWLDTQSDDGQIVRELTSNALDRK